ncbi:hypothetical protein M408DRAFT_328871 [Serendipita vermifera MAFF 305830]|uniref:Uncharacterized protein n=1 Tax=Serendipita vermifera MAFF 305830 TaxID=933852 RepID=A0A0C3BCN2_SERVB|nr:hypothetical protein M408DRAFT_328871 [Serendipita vermifera MAFF 305830]
MHAEYPTTSTGLPRTDAESDVPPPPVVPLKARPQLSSLGKDGQTSLLPPRNTTSEGDLDEPIGGTLGSPNAGPSRHQEPPPAYGNSRALSTWANTNRAAVSEDMESKLLSAGYMPGDDPDLYTEDEWKTIYGITRLELVRLRKLYCNRNQNA